MSFYFINVETIGKYKNIDKNLHLKFFASPANEFILHECRNNKKMRKYKEIKFGKNIQVQLMSFSYILKKHQ